MKTELIIALDTYDINLAKKTVAQLKDIVHTFKIGPKLFLSHGLSALDIVQEKGGKIFLDLKFFDIPSIIKNAVQIISKFNINMFTLHTLGGSRMIKEVAEFIKTIEDCDILPLGVTVLTSTDEQDLSEIGINCSIKEQVLRLANLAKDAGLKGLVCSAQDVSFLKEEFKDAFKLVTPGIRLKEDIKDDQRRTTSPEEAAENGADYIVMGRSILNSQDPRKVVEEVVSKLWIKKKY